MQYSRLTRYYAFHIILAENSALLITPESMLLSHGGSVTFLPGIPRSNSKFSAPELNQSGQCATERVNHYNYQCYL